MIRTVRGVVIRRREVTESSLILTAFTDRAGRLTLLAKGARRAKSPFRGRLELFSLCDLTYYEHTRRGLNILRECAVVDPHAEFRTDVGLFITAASFAELVDMGTWPSPRGRGIFMLLTESLDAAAACPAAELLRRRFEIRFLSLLGYSLRLDACAACGSGSAPLERFSAAAGGMVCAACEPKDGGAITVSQGTRAALRYLRAGPPESAGRIALNAAQAAEAREVLRRAISFYLERSPRTPAAASAWDPCAG
ncbi:MAG: DNA repair protein RecO [bacterium]|nr:DNA repair protein RecO [bacterium]